MSLNYDYDYDNDDDDNNNKAIIFSNSFVIRVFRALKRDVTERYSNH